MRQSGGGVGGARGRTGGHLFAVNAGGALDEEGGLGKVERLLGAFKREAQRLDLWR